MGSKPIHWRRFMLIFLRRNAELPKNNFRQVSPRGFALKKIPANDRSTNPQKIASKPKRRERACKRTA